MVHSFRTLVLAFLVMSTARGTDLKPAMSTEADGDVALDTDPHSSFWSNTVPIYAERDSYGNAVPGHRTEVRSRWTNKNLYFLFICPYEELYLRPSPNTARETNKLWNWDVAEVFIGSNFQNIRRYREFELSPQGEWMDLDIDLAKPHHEDGWVWNSGFQVAARIDQAARVWYGAVRIPFAAIDGNRPEPGKIFRLNLFRSQGPPQHRHEVAWQPTMTDTFHVPEHFGLLRLVGQ